MPVGEGQKGVSRSLGNEFRKLWSSLEDEFPFVEVDGEFSAMEFADSCRGHLGAGIQIAGHLAYLKGRTYQILDFREIFLAG